MIGADVATADPIEARSSDRPLSGQRFRVYELGGLFVSGGARDLLLPEAPIEVPSPAIEWTLDTNFFPGVFRPLALLPYPFSALVTDKRVTAFCVAPGTWGRYAVPLGSHPTWSHVAEAVAYERTGDAAHVRKVWEDGRQAWRRGNSRLGRYRRVSEFEKVSTRTWTLEDAGRYMDRLAGLARHVQATNGMPDARDLSGKTGRRDGDIGVAIGPGGEVVHFRMGHHRVMLARQLDIPTLRVSVDIVHWRWLRRATGRDAATLGEAILARDETELRVVRGLVRDHVLQTRAAR